MFNAEFDTSVLYCCSELVGDPRAPSRPAPVTEARWGSLSIPAPGQRGSRTRPLRPRLTFHSRARLPRQPKSRGDGQRLPHLRDARRLRGALTVAHRPLPALPTTSSLCGLDFLPGPDKEQTPRNTSKPACAPLTAASRGRPPASPSVPHPQPPGRGRPLSPDPVQRPSAVPSEPVPPQTGRQANRQTHTHTDRHRQADTHTRRQTQTGRHTHTQTDTDRQIHRHTHRDTHRH